MKYVFVFFILLSLGITACTIILSLSASTPALMDPQGIIAFQERNLIQTALLLMLFVVVPVIILTFVFAWKYRSSNTKARYSPNWEHDTIDEFIWWGFPFFIIFILSVITWNSTHELDPFRPLVSSEKPLTIQVVALNWKWLFIYPEQKIATVNFVQFPEKKPIDFQITADAPMNSFWIPQLGGQIYAMTGMSTHLHLMADNPGIFAGSSANFSGDGFSGMKFTAQASSQINFDTWVTQVKQSGNMLDYAEYAIMTEPSIYNKPHYYSFVEENLYDSIIAKFMLPKQQTPNPIMLMH